MRERKKDLAIASEASCIFAAPPFSGSNSSFRALLFIFFFLHVLDFVSLAIAASTAPRQSSVLSAYMHVRDLRLFYSEEFLKAHEVPQ